MKFKLKQEKLQEMLEKLMVKDIFPSSVISKAEDSTIYSVQKEEHGRAIRLVKFDNDFFEELSGEPESIELDIERTIGIVKNIPAGTSLVVETKGNKLSITKLITDDKGEVTGEKGLTMISFKDPEGEVMKELPFEIKEGIPLIGEGKIPLDTYLKVKLDEFKSISGFASVLKTEFYKFIIDKNGKIAVRVGNLHDFSDYHTEYPEGEVESGKDLEVIFTYGIPQIADTFRQDVNIKTKTNSPAWIFEKDKGYILGILVPPYVQE